MKIIQYAFIDEGGVFAKSKLAKVLKRVAYRLESRQLAAIVKIKGVHNLSYVPLFGEINEDIQAHNEGVKPKHLRAATEFINGKKQQNKVVRSIRACRSSIYHLDQILAR